MDYDGGPMGLSFTRYYNSFLSQDMGMGVGWSTSFYKRLEPSGSYLIARQGTAYGEMFNCGVTPCTGQWDATMTLTKDASGYTLTHRDKSTERYDLNRRLQSETDPAGQTTIYGYDANGRLSTVTGPFGHTLTLGYDASNHVATVTDAAGNVMAYSYHTYTYNDGTTASVVLTGVTYRDNSGTAIAGKIYHYEDNLYPNLMTGISYVDAAGGVTRYSIYGYYYNSANLADVKNGNAVLTQHAQTDNGVPQEKFTLSYDSTTQTTVTDSVGTQEVLTYATTYGLSTKMLTSKVNQSDGKSIQQTFDSHNNRTCRKDEEGRVTTYTYNATNQRTGMTEGRTGSCASPVTVAGVTRLTSYQYLSTTLNLPKLIESPSVAGGTLKKRITMAYGDSRFPALPTTITQSGYTPTGTAVSRVVTLSYNAAGQVSSIDGPRTDVTDVTTLEYYSCTTGGACGQLQSVTNALGHVTTYDLYDASGRVTQITDPNGLRSNYTYDARGRVITATQTPPTGTAQITGYTYNPGGDVTSVTFPDGRMLTYTYDAALYLRQVTDNLGNQIRYKYDLKGNRTQTYTYDPSGTLVRQMDIAYDLRNHVSSINAAGSLTQQVYDAVGNLTRETDPKSNPATTHGYDALNRLMQTLDALSGMTGYGHDVNDRPTSVTATNGANTPLAYDDLGNLLQEISPDRGTTNYSADVAGNVKTVADARGIAVTDSYDALNRLTSVDYPGTANDVTFVYDTGAGCSFGAGRLCRVQEANAATAYAYDGYGNPTQTIRTELGMNYTTRYTYDKRDRRVSLTYPDSRTANYTRDGAGSITTIRVPVNGINVTLVSNRQYHADGSLQSQAFGNGLTETRVYDLQGRLTQQGLGSETRVYGYDANGNLTSKQTLPETTGYGYDGLNRLTEDRRGATTYYVYDANGNRLATGAKLYGYAPGSNRLTQIGTQVLTYDAAGNIKSDANGNRYTYDAPGRLASFYNLTNNRWAQYQYDARGLRTQKTSDGGTTVYHYDILGRLIAETTDTGVLVRAYVWDDTVPMAQIDRNPQTGQESLVYLHTDYLGTPRWATNPQGTVVWRWEGLAFGTSLPNEDADGDGVKITINLRYAGMYADSETGLYYVWRRYYDPKTGRWITSDPIGLIGGLNTYLYARANPLRYIDPTGLIGWGGDPFMDDYSTSDLQQMNVSYLWLFAPGGNGNVWNSGFTQQDNVCSSIAAPLNSNKCTQQCCVEHDACYRRNLCNASSWIGNAPGVNVNFACQQCNAAASQCVKRNLGKKECDNGCQSK